MISKFIEVVPHKLFRGSAPSIEDVQMLHDKYGIKKIVSLDKTTGEKIDRVCKLLGITHIMLPINLKDLGPIAELLGHDLHKLLIEDGPTYVHCLHGKDRTGMVIAMFKVRYMKYSYKKAIDEAKKLGFGLGMDPQVTKLYEKIIFQYSKKYGDKDNNSAYDIADYSRDEAASTIDSADVKSFAPQLDPNHQYGYDYAYDQFPTRENVKTKQNYNDKSISDGDEMPLVGLYDNDAGIKGVGPIENGGGFVNT